MVTRDIHVAAITKRGGSCGQSNQQGSNHGDMEVRPPIGRGRRVLPVEQKEVAVREHWHREAWTGHRARISATLDLDQFTQFSRTNPKQTYTSVMGLLHRPLGLFESFRRIAANKAPGVDGVRKADYAADHELFRLDALSSQLRRGGYKAQPVRQVTASIQRSASSWHSSSKDRVVQDRASQILQAIWEPEFLDCSYGFVQDEVHDALRRVVSDYHAGADTLDCRSGH
ncbi:MAG: hypothetical protein R3C68_13930 [Myxococcota bacterium]